MVYSRFNSAVEKNHFPPENSDHSETLVYQNSFSNSYLSIATDIKKYQFSQIALV